VTNEEVAKGLLKQAQSRRQVVERALDNEDYAFVIRLSQECVELSLKAALYFAGIDFPKWHDVSPVLRQNRAKFPEWFSEKTDHLAQISEQLGEERERSMYGDEALGISPDALYGEEEAKQALAGAKEVFATCARLISVREE
jgi:HEPN domain-containing protein